MSFFGFDTNLPKDRSAGTASKGIFESSNPFADISRAQYDDDDAYVILQAC